MKTIINHHNSCNKGIRKVSYSSSCFFSDLHHDTVASWASKFIPRFASEFSYQSGTCLPIFLATFTTTFGNLLDALVLKKAALKRSSKRRLAASISSHIRSTASPGATFFQRWTCWIRIFSCVCNLFGGFSPTHLKKYAQVKLDHESPKVRGENLKKNGKKPPPSNSSCFSLVQSWTSEAISFAWRPTFRNHCRFGSEEIHRVLHADLKRCAWRRATSMEAENCNGKRHSSQGGRNDLSRTGT